MYGPYAIKDHFRGSPSFIVYLFLFRTSISPNLQHVSYYFDLSLYRLYDLAPPLFQSLGS